MMDVVQRFPFMVHSVFHNRVIEAVQVLYHFTLLPCPSFSSCLFLLRVSSGLFYKGQDI